MQVPYDAAVKVALHVKKELVDGDQLDVSQAQLEATIFRVMRKRAFGDDFISRYRMLSAFHLKRAPLVLLIVGGVCTGKTTVATKLSQVRQMQGVSPGRLASIVCLLLRVLSDSPLQRLNLPNVLQTDMVYQVHASVPARREGVLYRHRCHRRYCALRDACPVKTARPCRSGVR